MESKKEEKELKQNLFMSESERKWAESKGWSEAEYWYRRAMDAEHDVSVLEETGDND
jgi:hypothetical protein